MPEWPVTTSVVSFRSIPVLPLPPCYPERAARRIWWPQIDTVVGQFRVLRKQGAIGDARMSKGVCNLPGACIGGNYAIEPVRQSECRLTIARGALPREFPGVHKKSKEVEESLRICRTIKGVMCSLGREMVFKR